MASKTETVRFGTIVEVTCFERTPTLGAYVRYGTAGRDSSDGHTWLGSGSGTYVGCALSEDDGWPMHYFVGGEINGTPQGSHGFRAPEGTEPTADGTPTALIMAAQVALAVEQGKLEIREDVMLGHVPREVASFSDLHSYVDANEYAGLCQERADWTTAQVNEVQGALDEWIHAGGLREGAR